MDRARRKHASFSLAFHGPELDDMVTSMQGPLGNLVSSWIAIVQLSYYVRKGIMDISDNYQSSPHRERGNFFFPF